MTLTVSLVIFLETTVTFVPVTGSTKLRPGGNAEDVGVVTPVAVASISHGRVMSAPMV